MVETILKLLYMNSLYVIPTKTRTKEEYSFHLIGTEIEYYYDLNSKVFQINRGDVVIKQWENKSLTFEEFDYICKKAFESIFKKQWKRN